MNTVAQWETHLEENLSILSDLVLLQTHLENAPVAAPSRLYLAGFIAGRADAEQTVISLDMISNNEQVSYDYAEGYEEAQTLGHSLIDMLDNIDMSVSIAA